MTERDVERLLREADGAATTHKLPSAGLVYWRASIRARGEAARKAERPITIVEGLAVAAVAGVGAAVGGAAWHSFAGLLLPPLGLVTMVALGAAAFAVISPLALVALGSRMRFDRRRD